MNTQEQEKFDDIINIDRYRLDDEAENQPRLVWKYGKMYCKAQLRLDEAKAKLKVVEADVDEAVRGMPKKFGLNDGKKPTEKAISAAILRSDLYQDALNKMNKAQYRVNLLQKACTTLEHKRSSLNILNNQDERGYFARVKEPKEPVKKKRSLKKKR